ncbi:MAG: thioesterase family protein [Candidatus Zixiibacteriota bacterium]
MAVLKRKIVVRLHETDAAGLLFFANQFFYAHDMYEELLSSIGLPMEDLLAHSDFLVPIVHAESQYLEGLSVGQELEASVAVGNIGNTSYTLEYELRSLAGNVVGRTKTVQVSIDRGTRKKIPLPAQLRNRLAAFQAQP